MKVELPVGQSVKVGRDGFAEVFEIPKQSKAWKGYLQQQEQIEAARRRTRRGLRPPLPASAAGDASDVSHPRRKGAGRRASPK